MFFTCVSVKCSCLASAVRFATDKYFPRSNSVSSALIWAAENAVRGRFLRSSLCAKEHEPYYFNELIFIFFKS